MTRILLIEDSKNLNMALAMRLEHAGYEVSSAHDVEEGFALALEKQPALAIVDINLPSGSGTALAERLLDQLDLKVVLATANKDPTLHAQAEQSGAFALLTKPFDAQIMLNTISRALAAKSG